MPQPRLLIVDDEPLIRWSIGERMRAEGYDVLEAADGIGALEQFAKGADVVLLDSKLPDLDGASLLSRLQRIDPAVSVVWMTADSGAAAHDTRFPIAYKPFLLEELVALVDRIVAARNIPHRPEKVRTLALQPALKPS